jgi:acetolactate synthase regulatory subunit
MSLINKKESNHKLNIGFSGAEGAFLRILGLMERRGYHLQSCTLNRNPDGNCNVEVVVKSERPGDLLKRQLERLHDVQQVQLMPQVQSQSAIRSINIHAQA